MKKSLSLIISIMLALTVAFPVSAFSKAPVKGLEKYSKVITVTSVRSISDLVQKRIAKKADVIDNNIWSRGYLNDLGIKVNYLWTAPDAQMEQKMSVAISANDLPDIIPVNARQLKLLVDTGVAADMTKIFKDYASPFTMEMMKADNNASLKQATFGGKLMALPNVGGTLDNCSILYVRADWLKNLNLKAPKTMADVLKISKAFTHNDPDKNGKNDTYGLALEKGLVGGYADLNGFMEGYHAYVDNAFLKDASGNLVSGLIQPQVKTALAQLASMYKDGQIDKEFMVKDGTKVAEDIVSGKVGMMFAQHWVPFYPLQDCKNKDPKADWKAYPIVSNDNKPARPIVNGSASSFYVINKNMKNPEAAVKLYNYYYDRDPALSKDFDPNFHGQQGQEVTNPDQYFELAVMQTFYPLQNAYINAGVTKYFKNNDQTTLQNYWLKDNIKSNKEYLAGDNTKWSSYAWSGVEGSESVNNYYNSKKLWLQNEYIKADTESMTQKGATLKQMRDTTFTKIIMGAAPISEFDKFVSQWKKLGGDDIVKEVNASK